MSNNLYLHKKDVFQMVNNSKMSEIVIKLATLLIRSPNGESSSEAYAAALFLTHIGWNKELGHNIDNYKEFLVMLEKKNPKFLSELLSKDADDLIETIRQAKKKLYPTDRRAILTCSLPGGKVRVEWCMEADFPNMTKNSNGQLDIKIYK